MTLPASQPRRQVNTRQTVFRCFQREDGLWDIEGELLDIKHERFSIYNERSWEPGEPIHQMVIRATIDDDTVVREIAVAMEAYPHGICPQAMASMQRMVGCTMGRGWRKAIDQHMGKVQGCTHLRELLFNMATAAFQGMEGQRAHSAAGEAPPYIGTCTAWDISGPVVAQIFPLLYRPAGTP